MFLSTLLSIFLEKTLYLYKMENKKVKDLKLIAKQFSLHGYSKLRKAELIHVINEHERKQELTRKVNSSSILDEAVPAINIPILKPMPARKSIPSLSSLAGRVSKQDKGKINKFFNWLISFVPETIRTTVNEKVDKLKNDIKQLYNQAKKFEPKQKETALKGYLKTFGINGVDGVDLKTFIRNSKTKIRNLIKQQKKPIKLKFVLTCEFFKKNPGCIRKVEKWLYSGKVVVFGQKWLYSGKNGWIRTKCL